ncbi:glycogen synthase GlgA [Desulfuromonas thiophila]|uniref:Glycogen synthase n=1 Tax=Desulfuromonas thiophila TaxID=57664 RepID=A0A1G6YFQ2_9BACT|nr:glycogen synthase GlgA [Desulfuromonas thiophila]SDD89304.1 starch synthase [Desulfuromonas thiophila]
MRLLFATSEIYPVVKTGGLADVSAGLSNALQQLGVEVRLLLPAYAVALERLQQVEELARFDVAGCGRQRSARLLQARHAELDSPLWLIDIPGLFDRPGNPYQAADGSDWWDNGERFGLFCLAAAELAQGRVGLSWQPDLVQANDWQTGLLPALLTRESRRPRTLFTIHNLSYGGHFPPSLFTGLGLPPHWWQIEGVEFYGQFSFLKAGIQFADQVTTVSPSYAAEICLPPQGYGFDGLLARRRAEGALHGILNGIDTRVWNPANDPALARNYSLTADLAAGKAANQQAVLRQLGAAHPARPAVPLLAFIGRLVEQKGIDLLLEVLPSLLQQTAARVVLLGSGMAHYEAALRTLAAQQPERVLLHIGYDEVLAHRVEAAADLFLMPSRFEPCGLNQLYSLAYGTPPLVRATGGLRDTVTDADATSLAAGTATGFVFHEATPTALLQTVLRALRLWQQPALWRQLQEAGMGQDFSWQRSARSYLQLYRQGEADVRTGQ